MKLTWLMVTLFGVSIWYIPSTLSNFSGQHSYYNLDDNGSQVPCKKCHGDVAMELHTGYIHKNFTCDDCHRIQNKVQFASGDGDNATPGTLAHAASIVLCDECHSVYLNNTPEPIHEAFMNYGAEHNTSDNCIACHTATAVSIVWTRPGGMLIDTKSNGNNMTINGTGIAYNVRIETFGNQSGDAIAVSNATVI